MPPASRHKRRPRRLEPLSPLDEERSYSGRDRPTNADLGLDLSADCSNSGIPEEADVGGPTNSACRTPRSERDGSSLNSSWRKRPDSDSLISGLSSIGQSRVSLELSGNVSIELQTSRLDVKTPLEHPQPSKENSRRARLISRLIVGLAQGGSAKLEQYFHKFDPAASYGKRLITQRTPNIFDVRMFLKNPMPVGYFEVVPTFQKNAPAGYVMYRMSKSLTVEDRSLMKDVWGPCLFDDELLTPAILHPWITKGIKKAVKELQGIKIGRSTYGFMLSTKPPEVVVIVRAISEATLVSSVFTLHIFPAIMEIGRPRISGFHLRMPLPPILPYSRVGMKVMREVERDVEHGKLVWYLEGRHIQPPPGKCLSSPTRRLGKNRHVRCFHESGQSGRGSNQHRTTATKTNKTWVISLEPLERKLLDLSLKTMPGSGARKGFSAIDSLLESSEEVWSVLTNPQLTSLKLWTIKRTAIQNRSQQDWTKALLRLLSDSVNKKFGTYFLQPNINFLSEADDKTMELLVRHLKEVSCKTPLSEVSAVPQVQASTLRSPVRNSTTTTHAVVPKSNPKPHNPMPHEGSPFPAKNSLH